MNLYIKKVNESAVLPKKATNGSAGFDLCACIDNEIIINPGEIVKIPTGISAVLECDNYAIFIYARSGLASKSGVTMANGVGVVDSDYRGEIIVPLINLKDKPYTIIPHQRIAQMIPQPIFTPEIKLMRDLNETIRGKDGFGSTGL